MQFWDGRGLGERARRIKSLRGGPGASRTSQIPAGVVRGGFKLYGCEAGADREVQPAQYCSSHYVPTRLQFVRFDYCKIKHVGIAMSVCCSGTSLVNVSCCSVLFVDMS